MKVYVYPEDRAGCGFYRMRWPAAALADQGMDVTIVETGDPNYIGGLNLDGKLEAAFAPEDADVVVVHRIQNPLKADAVSLLRRKGIAVVVDMDDDLRRVHSSNPAWTKDAWRHAQRACRDATLVTVSTPALLPRYGAHGRARLLRNYVPSALLQPRKVERDGGPTFGWAGSLWSHPDDMDCLGSAVSRLSREGHEYRVVGFADLHFEKVGVEPVATDEVKFADWVPTVARELDVGLAPLSNSSFNECKSWLKPLEYSAAGVSWVASASPEYMRLAKIVGAPTATKPRQWYAEAKKLLTDEALRVERGDAARAAAASLTIEAHAHLWAEAWTAAVKIERQRARAH